MRSAVQHRRRMGGEPSYEPVDRTATFAETMHVGRWAEDPMRLKGLLAVADGDKQ